MLIARRYGGKAVKKITITMKGWNGSHITGSSDTQKQIIVPAGMTWLEICNANPSDIPTFTDSSLVHSQTGWVYNGTTTVVTSSDVFLDDTIIEASYTAVEMAIITGNDEIMSVGKWIATYGGNGTNSAYEFPTGSTEAQIKQGRNNDLIKFYYIKTGQRVFAYPVEFVESYNGNLANAAFSQLAHGGFSANGIPAIYPIAGVPRLYQKSYSATGALSVHDAYDDQGNALTSSEDFITQTNGKQYSENIYQALKNIPADSLGTAGTPLLEFARTLSSGTLIPQGNFYWASAGEVYMLFSNLSVFKNEIYTPLKNHMVNVLKVPGDENKLSSMCWASTIGQCMGFSNLAYVINGSDRTIVTPEIIELNLIDNVGNITSTSTAPSYSMKYDGATDTITLPDPTKTLYANDGQVLKMICADLSNLFQ